MLPFVAVVVDGGLDILHIESLYVAKINQIGQNYFFNMVTLTMTSVFLEDEPLGQLVEVGRFVEDDCDLGVDLLLALPLDVLLLYLCDTGQTVL